MNQGNIFTRRNINRILRRRSERGNSTLQHRIQEIGLRAPSESELSRISRRKRVARKFA